MKTSRRVTALVVGLIGAIVLSTGTALAWSPYGMRDHKTWTENRSDYAWASEALRQIIGLEIMNGYPGSPPTNTQLFWGTPTEFTVQPEFRPGGTITRAEFATILARVTGYEEDYRPGGAAPFQDTGDASSWYQRYLVPLVQKGIISTLDYTGRFDADGLITRQEMALWVSRAAAAKGVKVDLKQVQFSDVSVATAAALAPAVSLGIIQGYPDGTFRPLGNANRAEAAAMIHRLLPYLAVADPDLAGIQKAIQTGEDEWARLFKDTPGQIVPNYGEMVRRLSPYYTMPNLTRWDNPDHHNKDVRHHQLNWIVNGGTLDPDPEGWGLGFLSLYSSSVGYRNNIKGFWYYSMFYDPIRPLLVTDRFAIVDTTYTVQTMYEDGNRNRAQFQYQVVQYLKKEDGVWKRSGYGAETRLGRYDAGKPLVPGLIDRLD